VCLVWEEGVLFGYDVLVAFVLVTTSFPRIVEGYE